MRTIVTAALALALAGCLDTGGIPLASDVQPASLGAWALDCTLGPASRAHDPAWAQDCEARASKSEGPKQEIWLAVNPNDWRNVVIGAKDENPAISNNCVWNGVFVTHDGGATWKDVVIGGNYADRQPTDPWYGYACNTDPMLAFGANGDVHYGVEVYNILGRGAFGAVSGTPFEQVQGNNSVLTPGWKVLLATSHDGGDTWPDVITWDPDKVVVTDYSRMTVSPTTGSVIEAINSLLGCNVLVSRDHGKTAELPLILPQTGCRAIAASPEGTIVLASGGGRARFATSTDDARSFGAFGGGFDYDPIPGRFEENQFRTGTNFEMAYDLTEGPRRGTLYAVYADDGAGDADVFVRASTDDGATWGDAARVNGDAGENDQWMPNVVVAADGSVHAFFMDKRWDPANKLIDITHAVSLDGGQTWADERVTTKSFDGDLGRHQRGFPFIGDYLGIGASGTHVWGGFPDASDGDTTVVAAAHVARRQE